MNADVKPTQTRRLSHRLQHKEELPRVRRPKNRSIQRDQHDAANPYTVISNKPINDEGLSVEALGLLTYLISKPNDWTIWQSEVGRRFGMGRHKTRRIFKELEKEGYLFQEQDRQRWGGFSFNQQCLFEISQLKSSATASSAVFSGGAENQPAENRTLGSTDEKISTEEETPQTPRSPRGAIPSLPETQEPGDIFDNETDAEVEADYQQAREELMARLCPDSESEEGQARWAAAAKQITPVDAEALVTSGAVEFPLPPSDVPAARYWARAGQLLAIDEAKLLPKATGFNWDYPSMRMFLAKWKTGKINPPRLRRWVRSTDLPEEPLVQVLKKVEGIMTGEDYVGNFRDSVANLKDAVNGFCHPDVDIKRGILLGSEAAKKNQFLCASYSRRGWLTGLLCDRAGLKGQGMPVNEESKDMALMDYAYDSMAQFSEDEDVRKAWLEAVDFMWLTPEEKLGLQDLIKAQITKILRGFEVAAQKTEQEKWLKNHEELNRCLRMCRFA